MVSFGFFVFEIKITPLLLLLILLSNATGEKVEVVTSNTTATTVSPKPAVNASIRRWAVNDSYIKAYMDLRKVDYFKRNDQYESPESYNTVIRSSYLSDTKYPSLTHKDHWMNPTHSPPPSMPPIYGHHHYHHHYEDIPSLPPSFHELPYSSPTSNFFAAIHKKLSLKLLLKIILKLVLFKMIVKFIAVLCLFLFIPTLKSKEMTGGEHGQHGEHEDRLRSLDLISDFIWNSIENKNSVLGVLKDDDDETKKIKQIAELADDDNSTSGTESGVRFLQFCIDIVDRIVGVMLSYLRRQRNEEVDLRGFLFKKLKELTHSV